jgi:hypothetical protein
VTFALAVACARGGAGSAAMGHVAIALTLPSGLVIETVHYKVSAGAPAGIQDRTGTIGVQGPVTVAEALLSFPASTGDIVTLDATTSAGVACHGTSPPFDLVAGASASVHVVLGCGDIVVPPTGMVSIVTTLVEAATCPVLTAWAVSPLRTSVGGTIDVTASAIIPAFPSHALRYDWSPGPQFSPAGSATAKYTCPAAGIATLVLVVSDPAQGQDACTTTISFQAQCVGSTDGGGAAG